MISRRTFLEQLAGAAAGVSVLNPVLIWGTEASGDEVPGKEGMIVRSRRFLDLEMPPEFCNTWITPRDYVWKAPSAGTHTIMSRAADDSGRIQPQTAAWNPSGYLYNAIDQVTIHVVA